MVDYEKVIDMEARKKKENEHVKKAKVISKKVVNKVRDNTSDEIIIGVSVGVGLVQSLRRENGIREGIKMTLMTATFMRCWLSTWSKRD
jgi:hypothetical protein